MRIPSYNLKENSWRSSWPIDITVSADGPANFYLYKSNVLFAKWSVRLSKCPPDQYSSIQKISTLTVSITIDNCAITCVVVSCTKPFSWISFFTLPKCQTNSVHYLYFIWKNPLNLKYLPNGIFWKFLWFEVFDSFSLHALNIHKAQLALHNKRFSMRFCWNGLLD